ncbi:MAG: DUF4062 domain-containing protein [Sulfitobacter sp.]
MSEKRYQVFISSTFADLEHERAAVVQTLMEMDCIPAGMEAFTAVDEDQLEFIKTVIDDCDYYVLIIGGRYGSVDGDGISYTQREYEYALEKGLPVLAFVKKDISKLEVGKTDATDKKKMEALESFRGEVMLGRLVKLWDAPSELPGLVALGLSKAMKLKPGIGWVRGNTTSSESILAEINELRKENESLKSRAPKRRNYEVKDLSGIDTIVSLTGKMKVRSEGAYGASSKYVSWGAEISIEKVFSFIAPVLRGKANFSVINNKIGIAAQGKKESSLYSPSSVHVDESIFDTVIIQLEALGLIESDHLNTTSGSKAYFAWLTELGKQKMFELRTIRV